MRLLPKGSELGWTPYAWLIYHPLIYVQPILNGASISEWILTVLGSLIFLPTYFAAFWLKGKRALFPVALMALLGVLFAPFNQGASGFFIYAAAALGEVGRPGLAARYLALLLGIIAAEALLLDVHPFVWVVAMVFSLLIGGVNIHFAEVNRSQARLRLAQGEVERLATLAERERIARDLHDLLGHTLSVITLKSELAAKLIDSQPDRARHEIREIETTSREALAQVRGAVSGYQFAHLGAELSRAKVALGTAGIELDVATGPFDLAPDAENATALALREAVTNVLRHSRADRCRIQYQQVDGRFRLVVEDNGRGGDFKEGSGLAGMRQRIEGLDGELLVSGANGARIEILVPSGPTGRRSSSSGTAGALGNSG